MSLLASQGATAVADLGLFRGLSLRDIFDGTMRVDGQPVTKLDQAAVYWALNEKAIPYHYVEIDPYRTAGDGSYQTGKAKMTIDEKREK